MKCYTIEFYGYKDFKFTFLCDSVPFDLNGVHEKQNGKFSYIRIDDFEFNQAQIDFLGRIQNKFVLRDCENRAIENIDWSELIYFILTENEFEVLK